MQQKYKEEKEQNNPETMSSSSSPPDLLRAAIAPCTLFAFDLDDTLHAFRAASSAAAAAVFAEIVRRNPGAVEAPALRARYADILKRSTANAFADGRSSDEYRKERFAALLSASGLGGGGGGGDEGVLDELARVYKEALRGALTLKPGAKECLEAVKARDGRRAIVVTEGPRDAQEWTVRELGLEGCVERVVTTGEVRRGKVEEGFWREVLGRVGEGVRPQEVVMVGDSWDRDVEPARVAGCVVVWFCEGGWEGEGREGVLRVDDLNRLRGAV